MHDSPVGFVAVELRGRGLGVRWTDGHESFFHAVWLRDCCYCDRCGDCYSSNRYVLPSDVPADLEIGSASIDADGVLRIGWVPDGHESSFEADWLRRHCYDAESRAERRHRPTLWDASLIASLPEVDFAAVVADERVRLDLYRQVRDLGFAIVRGGPARAGGVAAIAELVGELSVSAYGAVFDLAPKSPIPTLGNTRHRVPPHTDEPFRESPPGIMVLGCVRPASDGGDTVLVDGFALAARLREEQPEGFALVAERPQNFVRMHDGALDQRCAGRTFTLDADGEVVGVRIHTRAAGPVDLPADLVESYLATQRTLSELMMSDSMGLQLRLDAGDFVVFDNTRVLHARTHFTDGDRFLQICSVGRESFHERLRLACRRLGFESEADLQLATGVAR